MYYATAGEPDAMFEALDAVYERRFLYLLNIKVIPAFDPYRADPRFENLLRRMRLA